MNYTHILHQIFIFKTIEYIFYLAKKKLIQFSIIFVNNDMSFSTGNINLSLLAFS